MNLLRKYYDKDSIGGGIPDEVRRKAEELYSTKEYFNKWLKELVPHEKELVIDMMAELASEELARLKEENERLRGENKRLRHYLNEY